jgi:hypothetical protein
MNPDLAADLEIDFNTNKNHKKISSLTTGMPLKLHTPNIFFEKYRYRNAQKAMKRPLKLLAM